MLPAIVIGASLVLFLLKFSGIITASYWLIFAPLLLLLSPVMLMVGLVFFLVVAFVGAMAMAAGLTLIALLIQRLCL